MPSAVPSIKPFTFGGVTIEIDTNKFSIPKTRKMNLILGAARSKYADISRFPMNVGESEEDWQKRFTEARKNGEIKRHDDEQIIRRADEDEHQHAARINASDMQAQEMTFEVVNGLAALFGQPQVSREDFDSENVTWPKLRQYLWEIFLEAGILDATEYAPPKSR